MLSSTHLSLALLTIGLILKLKHIQLTLNCQGLTNMQAPPCKPFTIPSDFETCCKSTAKNERPWSQEAVSEFQPPIGFQALCVAILLHSGVQSQRIASLVGEGSAVLLQAHGLRAHVVAH